MTPTVQQFLSRMGDVLGIEVDLADPEPALAKLGNLAKIVGATLREHRQPDHASRPATSTT
jgi:hypothetical protein